VKALLPQGSTAAPMALPVRHRTDRARPRQTRSRIPSRLDDIAPCSRRRSFGRLQAELISAGLRIRPGFEHGHWADLRLETRGELNPSGGANRPPASVGPHERPGTETTRVGRGPRRITIGAQVVSKPSLSFSSIVVVRPPRSIISPTISASHPTLRIQESGERNMRLAYPPEDWICGAKADGRL